MSEACDIPLKKIDDFRWEIPRSYKKGMRVPGLIFADEKILPKIRQDRSLEQVANVAHLPGIVGHSLAMPDIHWGYGFPIGGVAATDPQEDGVISPGGVGYDINCGVRLLRTNLQVQDVRPRLRDLVVGLFNEVPCGVGQTGRWKIGKKELRKLVVQGAKWAIGQGYGNREDLDSTEASGVLEDADPDAVSGRAYERGSHQLGTLGSGNHFLEIQMVDDIFAPEVAQQLDLHEGQVTVMIHSGSRGFGYQVCEDSLEAARKSLSKYHIVVPDMQLACSPIRSPEGQRYLGAMRAAANYAWNNRQCLTALAREVFEFVFQASETDLGMNLIYDVAHNIAKFESFKIDGVEKKLCVHRKGATRCFAGQPVIVPGDMGRCSYLLVGTEQAMDETFGTTCHGAGRAMSRTQALKAAKGRSIERELAEQGIIVMGRGKKGIAEEQPAAYKDVNDVVQVVHGAGIAQKVARMKPLGVIKG